MKARNLANPAQVKMADLSDIVKMRNLKASGANQNPVNEAQSLPGPGEEFVGLHTALKS